jgi:hypothetical protein
MRRWLLNLKNPLPKSYTEQNYQFIVLAQPEAFAILNELRKSQKVIQIIRSVERKE